jgi:hypothetical protein
MQGLVLLAQHHGHCGGWSDWVAHVIVSSVIHSVIYGLIFRLMHGLTLGEDVVLVAIVLAVVVLWGRARDRRGW